MDMTSDFPRIRQIPLGEDGKPLYNHHNFDAWWGSHWSLNILWSMAYPEVMDNFCNTMTDMYQNGGLIPRGPSGGNYTYVMIGDPAVSFSLQPIIKESVIMMRNCPMKVCERMLLWEGFATTPVMSIAIPPIPAV